MSFFVFLIFWSFFLILIFNFFALFLIHLITICRYVRFSYITSNYDHFDDLQLFRFIRYLSSSLLKPFNVGLSLMFPLGTTLWLKKLFLMSVLDFVLAKFCGYSDNFVNIKFFFHSNT